ncbi:hypothetical protein D6D18_04037 [Aureobasidium pullulans]|uniref:DUF3752 domain-containing protein n=1 Tax=Aureobasidium pullulans TaxID=5580 RepID=A0A4S8VY22_AURPU|nr:hypothetical protein D6D24_03907 [Aureobasidium pullulans]THX02363.1 hypothetical protein D6D18_04037 [Aureobasidium pullulans]
MSAAGPELPPHLLAKRKRQQEEEQKDQPATSSGANQESPQDKRQRVAGPELPQSASPAPASPTLPQSAGPTLPPSPEPQVIQPVTGPARPVAGPAPPPAPLDERPTAPPDSDSDSDDDDFGPALPSATDLNPSTNDYGPSIPQPEAAPARAQRDEWMTLPPQQDDLAARMDPSKIRARGFNTGKNARGGNTTPAGGNIAAAWTETPEQKLKRLQDEAMGVKPASAGHVDAKEAARNKEREAEARRIREQTKQTRGPSLMDQHKETNPENKEDDPTKRAFDREKDIGGSSLGLVDKKDLLNKASNFGSKFAGGSYL